MRKFLSLLMMLVAFTFAQAETSTLTFTGACGGSGTADDGTSWTVASDGTESNFDNTRGIHYGTKSAAVQYIKLSTSDISGTITKVVVNASVASGVTATVDVTVGGSAFGGDAQSLSATATDYTFSGSASGEIVVTVTKPSSATKALYVKSVAVTYSQGGETPVDPVVLTAPTFSPEAGEVESGTTVTITAPEGYYVSYTTNGDDPTKNGTLSENNVATVTVTEAITIMAATADDDLNYSDVVEAAYTIAQTTPDDPTPGEGTDGILIAWGTASAESALDSDYDNKVVYTSGSEYVASASGVTKAYTTRTDKGPGIRLGTSSATGSITINLAQAAQINATQAVITYHAYNAGDNGYLTFNGTNVAQMNDVTTGQTATVQLDGTKLTSFTLATSSKRAIIESVKLIADGGETPDPVVTVATPVITAEGSDGQNKAGEWIDSADVTITCSTEGASIYYTTDGTEPTNQSTLWNGTPFTLTATATVKAIAYVDGTASEVASLEVLIGEADPVTPPSGYVDDELTYSVIGVTGTNYSAWQDKSGNSRAVYAGNTAGGNESIQMRSNSNNSGIVSTVSGGKIRKVTLSWNSNTLSARKVAVYASNTAYTDASDLYGGNAGTKIGELGTTETELKITDDYDYVGIRSTSGALYLDGVTFSWEPAEAPAVATPVITSADETVVGPQTISITCATEAADVYYTIDGTEPSASSTLYEGAFQLTASATVKAIAILGNDQSAVASKAFTINVATSVADAAALDVTADTGKEFVIEFNEAKVIYVTDDKTFLREGDNAILLYKLSSLGLNLNDVVSGTVKVKFSPYNNLPEWRSTTGTSADNLTITSSDEAAQPIPATAAEIAAGSYLCNLVKLTGVKVVKDGTNYYASEDGGTTLLFQIRDNYNTGALSVFETTASNGARRKAEAVGGDEGFDIEGIVEVYNSTIQLAPTSATSIVTGVEDLAAEKNVASVKYFNLLGVESAEPFQGVNVVVTTYTDGSKTARKVVK